MNELLLAMASQFEELAAKLASLDEFHAGNVDFEERLEAACQASERAAQLIRRKAETMRMADRRH
jgi:hypothetical protein